MPQNETGGEGVHQMPEMSCPSYHVYQILFALAPSGCKQQKMQLLLGMWTLVTWAWGLLKTSNAAPSLALRIQTTLLLLLLQQDPGSLKRATPDF